MRRLLTAMVAGSMLVLAPAPARADTVGVTVNGFAYPAGLELLTEPCTTGTPPQPTALYRQGGLRGTHATGLSFGGATGYEAGVEAKVANPRALTSISWATYHPAGPDADTAADGHFVARFDPSGNNFGAGYYYAYYGLDVQRTGWGVWSNYANANLSWWWWNGTTSTPDQFTGTVRQLADAAGTNGSGAWVGFEFGCNGRDYYMDDFRVTTTARTTLYDFEGAAARAYLSTAPSHGHHEVVRDVTRLNLLYGQGHVLWGDALGLSDTVTSAAWLEGDASLYARPYGATAFRRVGIDDYTAVGFARFAVRASKQVQYQVRSSATSSHEAAVSRTLTVSVQRRIKARLADNVVRRGSTLQVTGQILPGDRRVTVTLQRKVGPRWRALGRAKTRAGGRYTLRAKAAQTGRWRLRVAVGTAKGNVGNRTPAMVVTIKKPPPPRPNPSYPPEEDTPDFVYNPPPPPPVIHAPSDEIKNRQMVRELFRRLLPSSAPEWPHAGKQPAAPVVAQPGVGQH